MSADEQGGPKLGLQPVNIARLCQFTAEAVPRLAKPLYCTAIGLYAALAVVCAGVLIVVDGDDYRTSGMILAYLLLGGAATFLCQVQIARYVAKDRLGRPVSGDCGSWWSKHLPGVVQSAGATFVALCGIYAASYLVFITIMLLIGPDNDILLGLLSTLFGYGLWIADLLFRAMAMLVAPLAGLALVFGWDALGRSFRLMRAAIQERPEVAQVMLGVEFVLLRVAGMGAGFFEGHEVVAFVLLHGGLSVAVRPVLCVLQTQFLIDALGRETPLDEDGLAGLLAGASVPE